jgi:putative transposase
MDEPEGLFQFGNGARRRLILMLLRADRYQAKGTPKARRQRLRTLLRVRNLVTDLHWKTINQLCSFRTVFLPSFSVSQMVRGTKLARSTKRLLQVFRYWDFQQKLLWKATLTGTQVHIVNESWTSKTCTSCGEIKKDLTGEETFECSFCGLKIGRDYQGARNILLKSYSALY